MADLPFTHVSWDRDPVPEHLWIASLAQAHGIDSFHHRYNEFLDAVDECWFDGQDVVCLGLISDFALFPEERRDGFLADNLKLARSLFWDPIGWALTLYPECPASWLIDGLRTSGDAAIDLEAALGRLRGLTGMLLGGRDDFATRVRVAPLARPLKNGKLFFQEGMPTVELLPRYPSNLNADERAQVESFVRATMIRNSACVST